MAANKLDEEFANFLFKVNQVNNIVGKLASNDANLQRIGDLEAQQYLGETKIMETLDNDEEIELTVKSNRTLLNRKAITKKDEGSQSQEAFMDEISKDADRRYRDKLMRREKMDTLKVQGNKAYKRGEYEKALSLYTRGIEFIKDSAMMYQNRALAYIQLKFYDKAIGDLELALRLNETSLKTWMLLIKCYYLNGDEKKFREIAEQAKEKLKDYYDLQEIEDYINELQQ